MKGGENVTTRSCGNARLAHFFSMLFHPVSRRKEQQSECDLRLMIFPRVIYYIILAYYFFRICCMNN